MTGSTDPIEKIKNVIAKVTTSDTPTSEKMDPAAPSWIKYVAMLTGVLAAFAGFLTVRSTTLTNQAIYESNQAILSQTQASDAWSEYQANSIKARVIEMQLLPSSPLSASDKALLAQEDSEIRARQPVNKQLATEKSQERETRLNEGMKKLAEKDLLEYAGMAVQLGIALASVAALVHRRIAFDIGLIVGGLGVAITAYALLQHVMSH